MTDEIEQNPEAEDPVESARNIYNEYALSAEKTGQQDWQDRLQEADAESLANFYAQEGGDPNQVVFYLEKTGFGEKEKWEILAQNFKSRADFAYERLDDAEDEKEIEKFKAGVDIYKKQAQTLRRGLEALKWLFLLLF